MIDCVVGRCTVWYGGLLCVMGGRLCGRAVYCVVGLCTVCSVGVLCGRPV